MDEYNTLEKVKELFESVNCVGAENCYFALMKDSAKYSGFLDGMEYPYTALLINQTESGIGFFHLIQPNLSLRTLALVHLKDLVVNRKSFTFLKNEDIKSITVRNFALLNKKAKSVTIKTKDKKTHYLCAKLEDDTLPYHNENFRRFVERYSK